MREFSASYDWLTKIVSALVIVLLVAIPPLVGHWWIIGFGAALVLATYGFSPLGYTVSGRMVRIRRLFREAEFPLESVRDARLVTKEDLKWTMRLFGSGGLFGYFGQFRTSKLGNCTWYCTRRDSMVVIATESKTALFSPDDAGGFLAAVRAEAPGLPAGPAGSAAIPKRGGVGPYGWIAGAIGLTGIVVGYVAVTFSPGPPKVRLTADSLTIEDRLYPVTLQKSTVDLSNAKVVAVDDADWRPVRRTNGFANSHYRSGWFRSASGQPMRLYLANAKRLVLLPGTENVLLEVDNPETFLASLRNQWR